MIFKCPHFDNTKTAVNVCLRAKYSLHLRCMLYCSYVNYFLHISTVILLNNSTKELIDKKYSSLLIPILTK